MIEYLEAGSSTQHNSIGAVLQGAVICTGPCSVFLEGTAWSCGAYSVPPKPIDINVWMQLNT